MLNDKSKIVSDRFSQPWKWKQQNRPSNDAELKISLLYRSGWI